VLVELEGTMNYALAHNGITPLKTVQVFNHGTTPVGPLLLEIDLASVLYGAAADPLVAWVREIDSGEGVASTCTRCRGHSNPRRPRGLTRRRWRRSRHK
jgi:hypothetical protein